MPALRLGIIGAGSIVEKKHLLALAEVPEITVVGLCRRDGERLTQLADRFRIARRYTDYRDLLAADGVDAVLVATGPKAQPGIVLDAIAAGKHVFAEKPMAETSAEARRMARAVHGAPVHFQIGFNKRFYYGYRTAKTLIAAGELGAPSGIQARFWFQPGRADPMLHNAVHFFDLVQMFMGPAEEVFARSCAAEGGEASGATVAVSLRLAGGAVGNLLLSSLASWDFVNEHVDVVGSNGNALSVENGRLVRLFRRGEDKRSHLYENTMSGHWWSGHEEQGFGLQLRAFARAALCGTLAAADPDELGLLAAGADDGVRALELLEAVRGSLTRHGNVSRPGGIDSLKAQAEGAGA